MTATTQREGFARQRKKTIIPAYDRHIQIRNHTKYLKF